MPPKTRGPRSCLRLLNAKGAEIRRCFWPCSAQPVIKQQLWGVPGSGFLSQLCSAQGPVPPSHAPGRTLAKGPCGRTPLPAPSSAYGSLPFPSSAGASCSISVGCSILKKDGGQDFLHLFQTWPKTAGLSVLLVVEGKHIAGGCQVLIFLPAFAITSVGCDKYWQALKISRAAATLHLHPLLRHLQPCI